MVTALVLISVLLAVSGVPQTTNVSLGTTLVALAACFGIWARIAQASSHHEQDNAALQKVTKK
jgi:hypothetical protein